MPSLSMPRTLLLPVWPSGPSTTTAYRRWMSLGTSIATSTDTGGCRRWLQASTQSSTGRRRDTTEPLPLPAAERLMPVFERLSHPELLERCSLLGTSNANESLHSVVWRRAPKTVFTTRSTVEIAVALGVVQFNVGGRVLVDAANTVVPGTSTGCHHTQDGPQASEAGSGVSPRNVKDEPEAAGVAQTAC